MSKADEDKRKAFTAYFPEVSGMGATFWADDYMIRMGQAAMLKNGRVAAISAVQPIFAGGQIVNANRLTRVQQEVSRLKYRLSEDEVLQRVTEAYWQMVSLQANLSTLDAADHLLDELSRFTHSYVRAGVRLPSDTLRLCLRRQELQASRLQIDNALALTAMSLANLMGVDWNGLHITDSISADVRDPATIFVPADDAAIRRSEYQLTERALDASRLQLRMERGKLLPSVGIGVQGVYANMMDKNETHGILYATLSVPISAWWGGSHAIRKARHSRQQAELSLSDARENLRLDIQHAWNSLVESYRQIDMARQSVATARENLRQNQRFYQTGTATMTDLLDAENQFIQSENRLTTACATYHIRLANYEQKVK
jgi:outer membrane protein TolC